MFNFDIRYISLAVFVCLNIVKAYFPDIAPELGDIDLLPLWCGAATYYASPTGSGTICSLESPCSLAYAYATKASNGDTIKMGYGSYDQQIICAKTLTFTGTDELGTGTEVLWTNTGTNGATFENKSGGLVTLNNIHLKNAYSVSQSVFLSNTANSETVFNNSIIEGLSGSCGKIITTYNKLTLNATEIRGSGTLATFAYPVDMFSPAVVTYNYGIVRPSTDHNYMGYFRVRTGATLNSYNVIYMGARSQAIVVDSGGTLTGKNNSFISSGAQDTSTPWHVNNAGTATLSNNYASLVGAFGYPEGVSLNAFNGVTNTDGVGPTVGIKMRGGYESYFNLQIDAGATMALTDYAAQLYTTVFRPRGKSLTLLNSPGFSINAYGEADAQAKIRVLHQLGIDVGSHGHSHTDMDVTTNCFKFQYNGVASSPTVNVDIAGLKIYFAVSGGTDNATYTIVDAVDGSEVVDLKAWLVGKNWSIVDEDEDCNSGYLRLTSLTDTGGAQPLAGTPAKYQATLNKTDLTAGFYKNEIADTKAWLESTIQAVDPTYTCDSWSYSSTVRTAEAAAMVKAAGHTFGDGDSAASHTSSYLGSINAYSHYRLEFSGNGFGGPTADKETLQKFARAWFGYSYWEPSFFSLNTHGAYELTIEQVGWLVEVLEQEFPWIQIVTLKQMANIIRNSGEWTTADDITYTRAYDVLPVSNYRLRPGSPAINAGVDVGLTTDYLGKPIRGLPDIGAYEFQSKKGSLGRTSIPSLFQK